MKMLKYFFFLSLCLSSMAANANKLSISGKPQDEAHCAMLGSPQLMNNDKRCKKTEIKKVDEWYEANILMSMRGPNIKNEDMAAECKNIEVSGKNSDSDLVVKIANQIEMAKKNNLQVSIELVQSVCKINFKTKEKSAICSHEWGIANTPKITKVEVLSGNVPSRKTLEWKNYCLQ